MKKVKWSFCEHSDVVYDGFSNGVKWNGWDTILVDEATYKKITNMLYCDTSTDDELEDKTYRENNKVDGLYDLCGYTTLIKEVVVMSKNDIISNLSQIEEFLLYDSGHSRGN